VSVAIVYFVLLAVAFFFLIVRPQRRRVTAHRAFVSTLSVGDEVITTGGIFGTVVELEADRAVLEVSPGVPLTVAIQALAQAAYPVPAETVPDAEPDDLPDAGDDPDGSAGDAEAGQ
jgi:preprotein translocase subunit YajC